jgi:hypothetical protein
MGSLTCRCPPFRLYLSETGCWEDIEAHLGSCPAACWPQTGRPFSRAHLGPRSECTCIRASDVPEYVHDYRCPLDPSASPVKAAATGYLSCHTFSGQGICG